MEHEIKVLERVFEKRLRKMVEIREEQYGLVAGKGTIDAIIILRQLQEKYLENDKELYLMFVDLEKAFDRVPRVLIASSLRRKGVVECYVKAVMKIYKEVLSQVIVEGEDSEVFAVRVGIHQGSILLLFFFDVVMDMVIEEVAKEERTLMYADDLVLICETKEEARQRFAAWRNALERKGLKVNISKMKVMRCAWDGVPKKAAVDHTVCVERGWV